MALAMNSGVSMMTPIWSATAIGIVLKSTVLSGLTLLTWHILRRKSAALLHLILLSGLVVSGILPMLLLPHITKVMPSLTLPYSAGVTAGSGIKSIIEEFDIPERSQLRSPNDALVHQAVSVNHSKHLPAEICSMSLALLWAGGAATVLFRLAISLRFIERLADSAQPCRITHSHFIAAGMLAQYRHQVRFLASDETTVPLSFGFVKPTIVLPRGYEHWSETSFDAILCHELIHLRRRDFASNLVANLICAMYWFNPISWKLRQLLSEEQEKACDNYVLLMGVPPSLYASTLLAWVDCPDAPSALLESAIAGHGSLKDRICAILDDRVERRELTIAHAVVCSLLAVCSATVVGGLHLRDRHVYSPASGKLSGPTSFPSCTPLSNARRDAWPVCCLPSTRRYIREWPQGEQRLATWNDGGARIEENQAGVVKFHGDMSDIDVISPGGFFELYQTTSRSTRRLIVLGLRNSKEYYWFVDGTRQAFDGAAQAWLAARLIELERRTAYGADSRVEFLMRTSGTAAVLSNMKLLLSDNERLQYFFAAIEHPDLSTAERNQFVEKARFVFSDPLALQNAIRGL